MLHSRPSTKLLAQSLLLAASLIVIIVTLSGVASADLDTYSTGDGHEGGVTVSTSSVLNYSAPLSATASTGATALTTGAGQTGATGAANTTGSAAQTQFEADRLALVIQSSNYGGTGATSGSQSDINLTSSNVGAWELARIKTVSGSMASGYTITFYNPLVNTYSSTGAQIVAVPEFTNVTVNTNRSWSANSWNGTNGGITAFLASGTVNLASSTATINADADGFRGGLLYNGSGSNCTQLDGVQGGGKGEGIVAGVYPGTATSYASRGNVANGGGGGDCENAGGGGGGNGGTGGKGGLAYGNNADVGGLGGTKLVYSAFDHAVFGGGGGAGDENNSVGGAGGNGGGLVFVRANTLTGSGKLSANGATGAASANVSSGDGAGGGGAGGVVYARFNGGASCTSATALGGAGGNEQSTGGVHGPGGGGAGGHLVLQSASGSCPTNVGNGVAGTTTAGGATRSAGPTSSTDAVSSGATDGVSGGGGVTTPTAAVSTPAPGAYVNSSTPAITGTSSMNAGTVRVTIDGTYVGSTTTNSGGAWSYTPSAALSSGSHTYSVQPVYYGIAGSATANRTLIVDTSAPTVTVGGLTSPTASGSSQTATIAASDNNSISTQTCKLDSGSATACTTSYATGALAAGTHTITVVATDVAGNVTTQSATIVVDQTAPAVAIGGLTSPTSSAASQAATIVASDNVAIATQTCKLDGGAATACTTSFATGTLTAGTHTITVIATDTSGNATTQTATIVVDQTNPSVSISGLTSPTASTSSQTATITASDNVALGTLTCKLDTGAATSCIGGTYATGTLAAGSHTITVVATDTSGNSTTQTATVIVDQTVPTVSISGLTSPTASSSSQTATITAGDNVALSSVTCRLDTGSATSCVGGTYATGSLPAGTHTITVVATDTSGNATTQTATVVVDQTAPTVAITGLTSPTNSTTSQTASIAAADNVAIASQTCKLDTGTASACTTSFATGTLAAGTHTITVVATDTAGNQTTQTATIVVDTTAPTVAISGLTSPTNSTASQTATITASDNLALGSVTCKVDTGSVTSCIGGTFATGTLATGSHTITVAATDTAGNQTTQTATVVIDTSSPSVSITPPTSPTASTASQNIAFTATDDAVVSLVQCKLDAGSFATCSSPYATGTLAAGTHTVTVRATDNAGNQTSSSVTIVVDQTPPSIAISGLTTPTNSTASQTATISASDNVAIATQTCKLDTGAASACTTSFATGALAAGTHTITVVATDTAGNAATQTANIVVDTTAPSVSITGLTSPTNSTASQTASIAASDNLAIASQTCKIDTGTATACTTSFASGALAAGTHTITVVATDTAGNATTQTATIVVDQTAPSVSIGGLTSPTASGSSQTATITASDNLALSTVTCKVDTGATSSCIGGTYATGALAAGTHTITAVATDTAGNSTTQTATVVIDQTAPAAAITGLTSPTNSNASQTASIAASDNVALSSVTCKVDTGAATSCLGGSYATGALPAGTHTVTVAATDTSGNSTTQTATIVVDQTAPTVSISGLTSPTTSSGSQTATISATDNVAIATQTCKLDTGSAGACTTSFATGTLAAGSHTITVVATDTAGNSTTQTATVVVDQTAPTVSISGLTTPTSSTASQTATISAADNVAIATQTCKLDTGTASACTTSFATGVLTAGTHTITVVATDTAGNSTTQTATVVVDQTAPTVSISGLTSPTNSTASQTATIAASDNVAIATQTCKLDTGSASACTTSFATGTLAAGTHTITVVATDTAGNVKTQTATIVVDQTAPVVTISGLTSPTGGTASQTATISATDNLAIATQTCKLDTGTASACTTSFATGTLAAGTHTITVVATDTAGNSTTQTATIVVDTTAPSVAISGLTTPTNSTASQTATIAASDNVAIATQTCKLDTGTASACTTSFATGVLAAGTHTITVVATDTAGNSTTQTATVVVDQTAPTVTISGLTSPTASGAGQTATIAATDNVAIATQTCKLDTGTASACTTSFATGALAAGTHTVTVVATDTAGNVKTQTATIVVDQTAPTVAISGLTTPTNSATSQTATIAASDNVAIATQTCKLDTGSAAVCTTSFATGTLAAGTHTITVVATDTAGNSTTQIATIVVDQTAPTVAITGLTSPANSTASQTAAIAASDNVAIATQTCKLDTGTATACTTSFATGTLTAGTHTITVVATDTAGNVKTQTATIVVDTTAPTLTITGLTTPTNSTASQTATITAADNLALNTVTCKLDGGSATSCISGTFATGTLATGTHTITVVATDTAGNTTTKTATVVIDTNSPTVSITPPVSPTASSTSQNIAFTATDDAVVSLVECKLDAGSFAACSSPYATGTLAAGSHTITVRATDNAGNQTSASVTIVVDQTPPSIAISGLTSPTSSSSSQSASITATDNIAVATQTCTLDGGSAGACATSFATGTLAAGTHTISVTATDTAGNSATQTATIVVDQTNPSLSISGGTSPTNSTAGQALTIASSDNVGLASVVCRTNGGAALSCAGGSYATGTLNVGSNTITATATDTSGNITTRTYAIVVDQTAPTLSLAGSTTPTNSTASQSLTITAADNLALASVTCATNGGAAVSCAGGSYATDALTVGSNTITAVATDTSGNSTTQSITIVVDQTDPGLSITGAVTPTQSTSSQTLTIASSDASGLQSVSCSTNGGPASTCAGGSYATGTLSVEANTITAVATDNAGNVTTETVSIVVDQTPPSVAISGLTSPIASGASQTAAIAASDNIAIDTETCTLDGGAPAPCTTSFATGPLAEGDHTITVFATDTSGNSTSESATIVVDQTAPAISVTGLALMTNSSDSQTAAVSATDLVGVDSITCAIDAAVPVACDGGSFDTGALPEGSHTVTVIATDTSGNSSVETATIVVDQTDPTVAISGLTSPTSSSASQTATITTGDDIGVSDQYCWVDSAVASPCSTSFATGTLSAGTHTVHVTAMDAAGNSATGTATIVVDQTDPAVAISGLTSPTASGAAQTLAITASDNVALDAVTCQIDSEPAVSCASGSFDTGALAEGSHTVTVVATDTSGNAVTETATIVIDQTAPSLSITGAATPTNSGDAQTLAISAGDAVGIDTETCRLDAAPAAPCTTSFDTGPLAEGSHTVTVVVTDSSGNSTTQSVTIVVDQTAPSLTIGGLTSPTASGAAQSATITAADGVALDSVTCSIDGGPAIDCSSGSFDSGVLADGSHTVSAVAVDTAGNSTTANATIFVDSTAPAAPQITTPSTDFDADTTGVTIAGSAEPDSEVRIYDDGALIATVNADGNGDWAYNATLAEGSHPITATSTDSLGNTGDASSVRTINVDLTAPPAPSITSAPASPVNSTDAHFEFSAGEPGGTLECSLDGGVYANCTSPVDVTVGEGPHTFSVRQRDAAGNAGSETTVAWTVDLTAPAAPSVTLDSPTGSPTARTGASVSYALAETGGIAECSLDGAPFAPCDASPVQLSGLADGAHSFAVRQTDDAGNTGGSQSVSWTVDTIAPDAPGVSADRTGTVAETTATITYNAAEPGGTFECSLDGDAFSACDPSPVTLSGLADGPHSYAVRQLDDAGNAASAATVAWTVDTTPPAPPTITDAPDALSASSAAHFEFTGAESGGSFECSLDGDAFAPCVSPVDLTVADGAHNFRVRQIDATGNVGPVEQADWTADTTPPAAPALTGPSGPTNSTEVTLTFGGDADTVRLECSLNAAPATACPTSPASLGSLPDGPYSFTVTAFDAAGNSSGSALSWTVDTSAPGAPTITAGPAGQVPSTSAQFEFTGAESGGLFKCQLGDEPAVTCTSPFGVSGLSDGTFIFKVRQVDSAGNVGPAATRTWTVDTTPPPAPSVTGPTGTTGFTTATIAFSDSEAAVSFACSVDGATYQPCTSPLHLSGLADGPHTVNVRAYDAAGNGSAPGSAAWTVDHTLFTAEISGAPSGVVNTAGASLTLSSTLAGSTYECSLDGAPFAACTSPVSLSGLSEGSHTFTARATNGAQTSPDVSRTWSVDLTLPAVAISAPTPGGHVNSSTPQVVFTAEAGATTRCKVDGGAFAVCSSPFTTPALADGSHSATVQAVDAAGNAATAVTTFTIDTGLPAATISGGPAEGAQTSDTTPSFTLTADEPARFECSLDGAAFTACANPFAPDLGGSPEGAHTLVVHATDLAGNPSPDVTRHWTVDTTAPAAPRIDSPADNTATQATRPTVAGDAGGAEPGATLNVYVDGQLSGHTTVAGDGSWSFTIGSALADATYIFTAKAQDTAGNLSAASNSVHIRVDASDPVAQLTGKPGAKSNDSTPTFSFRADEPATFECRIDAGAYAACSSPLTAAALADGAHSFFVRAIDASGNVSVPVEWDWTVDTSPPVVTVGKNTPADGLSPTFTFSSSESGTTYKCRVDGSGAFTTCSSPFSAPTLPAGDHTLEVQATDQAGNTASQTVSFTVTAAPVSPPAGGGGGGTEPQVCTGSGDEPGVPANMSVLGAVVKKNKVIFTTSSDKYILVRVSIYYGNKLVGTSVRANNPGKRIVAIKTKKAVAKNKRFTVRLSAITMTGGKSVAGTTMVTDAKGKATLLGADGSVGGTIASTVDCNPEKGAKKLRLNVASAVKVKVGVKKLVATAKSSDYAVATFRIIQNGQTVGRRVFLLQPNKKLKAPLKVLSGHKLVKGKAMVQVATCSVDGVWQLFKKPITVR